MPKDWVQLRNRCHQIFFLTLLIRPLAVYKPLSCKDKKPEKNALPPIAQTKKIVSFLPNKHLRILICSKVQSKQELLTTSVTTSKCHALSSWCKWFLSNGRPPRIRWGPTHAESRKYMYATLSKHKKVSSYIYIFLAVAFPTFLLIS